MGSKGNNVEFTAKEISEKSSSRVNKSIESGPPKMALFCDYRPYLKEFYEYKRALTKDSLRPYSYATFAASADIKSPNYLKLIIEGQRNLSIEMARKFARAMALGREETDEFTALVEFTQAQEPIERNRYLKILADIRVRHQLKNGEINAETWDKVPSWVTWVLYALADQKGVRFDIAELFETMRGKARPEDIRRSLEKLLAAGELVKDPTTGFIQKGRELMSGSESVPVELVRKLQSELIYLGLESLFQDTPQDREIGTQTLALTEGEFEHLKFELRQFRKRWLKDVSVNRKATKGTRVFQLNIQLFPVTLPSKGTS